LAAAAGPATQARVGLLRVGVVLTWEPCRQLPREVRPGELKALQPPPLDGPVAPQAAPEQKPRRALQTALELVVPEEVEPMEL
jgi:hypothetical protein